jgi:hypothetical protein
VEEVCSRWPPAWVLVVRHSPAGKGVNMEAEETTTLEPITRQRLMKTQQTEKA